MVQNAKNFAEHKMKEHQKEFKILHPQILLS